jgi:hypothetical protein
MTPVGHTASSTVHGESIRYKATFTAGPPRCDPRESGFHALYPYQSYFHSESAAAQGGLGAESGGRQRHRIVTVRRISRRPHALCAGYCAGATPVQYLRRSLTTMSFGVSILHSCTHYPIITVIFPTH